MIVKTPKTEGACVNFSKETPNFLSRQKRILLAGNPNVGKSVIFSALSGIQAESSNYAGTTVSFKSGQVVIGQENCLLIDLPGAYSLSPTCPAEQVTANIIAEGADVILCVLDATRLKHSIRFALELKKYHIPTLYLLNLTDIAKRMGISVDCSSLEKQLGATVIPCVAVKGIGLDEIKFHLKRLLQSTDKPSCNNCKYDSGSSFSFAEKIAAQAERHQIQKRTLSDRLGELMIHPFWGVPIAVLILCLSAFLMIQASEFSIHIFFKPLADSFSNFFQNAFSGLNPDSFLSKMLIGEYGICMTSFDWILGSILPYVFFFYLIFSFLEDCGYLPRLSLLFDNIMSRIGLQGGSVLPLLLGYGCAVPAIIGSRCAASKKERIMIASAICFAIPCTSQTGALMRLFHGKFFPAVPLLFLISFLVIIIISILLNKWIKGQNSPMMMEIPHLLFPNRKAYSQKILLRMKHFLLDAEMPMLGAVFLIAFVSSAGLLELVSQWLSPLVVNWLGLPKEASLALLSGMIRREMSVAPLLQLNLTALQTFTGAAVSLLYLPCLSALAILVKEFGIKTAVLISAGTAVNAFFIGGCVHFIGKLLGM